MQALAWSTVNVIQYHAIMLLLTMRYVGTTKLLLTTYDGYSGIKVFRISVSWNYPNLQKREPLPRGFRPQPMISVEHLCAFRLDYQSVNGLPEYVTGIHVIPAMKDAVSETASANRILVVTSQASSSDHSSRVQQYELRPEQQTLHAAFSQLSTGGMVIDVEDRVGISSCERRCGAF